MDFLRAMAEAGQMGLTKEEFLPIWTQEARAKESRLHRVQSPSSPFNSDLNLQACKPTVESLMQQQIQRLEQTRSDMKHELQTQLQHLQNQIQEKQAIAMDELERKQKLLREEFSCHFELLTKHVTNAVESHSSCLKHFFIQEMELLQQDLVKKLDGRNDPEDGVVRSSTTDTGENVSSDLSSELDGFVEGSTPAITCRGWYQLQPEQQQVKHEQTTHQKKQERDNQPLQEVAGFDILTARNLLSQQHRQEMGTQFTGTPQESYQQYVHVLYQQTSQALEHFKLPCQPTPQAQQHAQMPCQQIPQAQQQRKEEQQHDQQQQSQQARIQKQLQIQQPQVQPDEAHQEQTCSTKTYANVARSNLAAPPMSKKDLQAKIMPNDGVKFSIPQSDQFSASGKTYISPLFQTFSKVCKARLRLGFDSQCNLSVSFLVSGGDNADIAKYPMVFESKGHIYNIGSRRYTLIWNSVSEPFRLTNPEAEFPLLTPVCLQTSRGQYPDIKYQKLEEKKYTGKNCLQFEWHFSVTEVSGTKSKDVLPK